MLILVQETCMSCIPARHIFVFMHALIEVRETHQAPTTYLNNTELIITPHLKRPSRQPRIPHNSRWWPPPVPLTHDLLFHLCSGHRPHAAESN